MIKIWKNKISLNNGFTLIEILVAIAIVSIISVMVYPNLVSIRQKARDARRKADLREIKLALEQFYAVCGGHYPDPNGDNYDPIVCYQTSPETNIMTNVPKDPKTGNAYYCPDVVNNCDSTKYYICADMETEAGPYCVGSVQ